jgi:ABC-type transporter Mla maintaining outer membrane lipid asymmetry ATPase subunit MlaF
MSTTAIPAEILPEQIDVPAPDAVAVAATDLTRRYGESDTAVDALRGVPLDVAEGKLTAIMGPSGSGSSLEDPDHFLSRSHEAGVLRVTEPEQDDEAEREKRASERLDVDDLPRAPVEPEAGEDQT